ncbi:putative HTH-type transcriptional regulator YybR [Andreprevotia sp. IGB-42]|uniref:winged helix-turn-helix transcriptional regulator n=1 Tax=Andreprevotia sp. IGB-42 TaxID=2497473 RepID=UPI00157EE7E5|nr:helix-turn-helix domain-containing protein [Andreprevotia sp. IGB-42]KAF0811458.1 putative HTH-type transcriptional regulator YybR [Andreprevotia sp. IGB-42]
MTAQAKSGCPINLALELLGDRWSLLIIRDMMFAGKRHFREFLQSEEGISSNILTERLARLLACGIVTRADDPDHKQKAIYSLTAMGIELLPLLAQIGIWGNRHLPASTAHAGPAKALEQGGSALIQAMQAELAQAHLQQGG